MFNLKITGELGPNVLPSEFSSTTSAVGKAWQNFLRETDGLIKIQDAQFDNAGKTINLPVAVHAAQK